MYTVKEWLAEKEIKQEAFEAMTPEEQSTVANDIQEHNIKAFKALQEKGAEKEVIEAALKQLSDDQAAATQKSNAVMQKMGEALKELMKAGASAPTSATLKSEIAEKKAEFIALVKGGNGTIEIKALTNRAAITNNEQALDLPDVGQLATGRMRAIDLFPKLNISGSNNNGTVRYYDWDEATTVRAAAMIAEGGTFPESTAKWEKFSIDLKKIGDSMPVTEEFFEDEAMFAAELEMFLLLNVDLEANNQVINGDGTGNNLTGLVTSSPAYVPVVSGITDASIYDLIVKVKEDVETDQDAKYMANFALMNIADVNLMKLKKDGNNNYIMPPFVDRSGNVVDGITIVVDNKVEANTMFMGDSRFGRVYVKNGLTIARGTVGTQFVEDTETLKVRKRMLLLVRNVDKTGFRKVTDIAAALVTLAT